MKKHISFILSLILLISLFPVQVSAATKTENVPSVTDKNTTKTFTLTVDSSIDVSTVSYSGKGILTSKTLNGDQLTVTIQGVKVTEPSKIVYGYKDNIKTKFDSSPGNAIWRYSDGKRWQINTLDSNLNQTSYDKTGVELVSGVSQKPAYDGSLTVKTYGNADPSNKTIYWFDNNDSNIPSDKVDTTTIEVAEAITNSQYVVYSGNIAIQGYKLIVNHSIHHGVFNNITDQAPASIGTGGNVLGLMYLAPMKYMYKATSLPYTAYEYGGTITYETTSNPYVISTATANPSEKLFDNADTNVTVTVNAELKNYTNTSNIDHWTIFAGEKGDYDNFQRVDINQSVLNTNASFNFIIPASVMDGIDDFTKEFETVARVYFKSSVNGASDLDSFQYPTTHIFKTAPLPENLPPVADISVDDEVMAGEEFRVHGRYSYDEDGTIVDYRWSSPSGMNGTLLGEDGGRVWFPYNGSPSYSKMFGLRVEDDQGDTDSTDATVTILEPVPTVKINLSGIRKENRKVTLSISADTPKHYPIDETKTVWTITPVSGGTASDVKYEGSLTGTNSKDTLYKKAGDYKARVSVTNTAGFSATDEYSFSIRPDEVPLADYDTVTEILRDPNKNNKAEFKINDNSYSADGDVIEKKVWKILYDSNNDGNFTDETPVIIDETNLTLGVNKTFTLGGQAASFKIDSSTKQRILTVNDVGEYELYLEVTEGIPETTTISKFLNPEDYKKDGTWY